MHHLTYQVLVLPLKIYIMEGNFAIGYYNNYERVKLYITGHWNVRKMFAVLAFLKELKKAIAQNICREKLHDSLENLQKL